MKNTHWFLCLTAGFLSFSTNGCGRPAPTAPELDPPAMAAKAMELYDADRNGKLSAEELKKSPALAFSRKEMDTDKDGALSADEIQKRLEAWAASGITLTAPEFRCKIKGKVVKEGTLKLIPDPFMGETYLPAEGEFLNGSCQPAAPNEGNYQAIPLGFYSVEITSPNAQLTPGTVGVEVFDESAYYQKHKRYDLSDE